LAGLKAAGKKAAGHSPAKRRIIIAMSGASGVNYAIALLRALKKMNNVETHLIMSKWAEELIKAETGTTAKAVRELADFHYSENDMGAAVSSTSFKVDSMAVIPASVKTCAGIAHAYAGTLINRCADNMLRTRKTLVVCVRETPLSAPALESLHKIALAGGIVFPLSPGFYHKPREIKDLEDFVCGKVLDLMNLDNNLYKRWK